MTQHDPVGTTEAPAPGRPPGILLRHLLASIPDAVALVDAGRARDAAPDPRWLHVNAAAAAALHLSMRDVGRRLADTPAALAPLLDACAQAALDHRPQRVADFRVDADGPAFDLWVVPDGEVLAVHLRRAGTEAAPLPGHCSMPAADPVTGLPNRAAFLGQLQRTIDEAARQPGRHYAVALFDFDRFKIINHGLGHDTGDRLLRAIADRLLHNLRRGDAAAFADPNDPKDDDGFDRAPTLALPARTGGDEFLVLFDYLRRPEHAPVAAQRLARELARPYSIDGRELYASAAVAVVAGSADYVHAADMLRDADNALQYAKSRGGPECIVFQSAMRTCALERLDLESDLRQALPRRQFELHYQPILSLSSGGVLGFEALVRWRHPQRGMVRPDQFITLAEELGLIVPLGRWVLEEACRTMVAWQQRYAANPDLTGQPACPRIAVNVSKRQLAAGDFADTVARVLSDTGLHPRHLELELTESLIMAHVDEFMPTLERLRDMGVALSMDDFGTGHSSLSMLHRFPIDVLKIDRQFLKNLQPGKAYGAILQAIIVLAHTLELEVVAEGIETPEQLAQLQALACDRGQGYFFATPMPADAAERYLHAQAHRHAIA